MLTPSGQIRTIYKPEFRLTTNSLMLGQQFGRSDVPRSIIPSCKSPIEFNLNQFGSSIQNFRVENQSIIEITTCKHKKSTWGDWKTQPLYRFYFLLKKKHSISKVKIPLKKTYPEPSLLDSASFMNIIVSYIFQHLSSTPPLTRFKLISNFPTFSARTPSEDLAWCPWAWRSIQVKETAAPLVGNPIQNTGWLDMKPGKVGFMKILESEASRKRCFFSNV